MDVHPPQNGIATGYAPHGHMAVGQNQWYHFFGVGVPPIFVNFSGDWDVHGGYDLDFDPLPYEKTHS